MTRTSKVCGTSKGCKVQSMPAAKYLSCRAWEVQRMSGAKGVVMSGRLSNQPTTFVMSLIAL